MACRTKEQLPMHRILDGDRCRMNGHADGGHFPGKSQGAEQDTKQHTNRKIIGSHHGNHRDEHNQSIT
ncbi:hypothetical protein D3C81_2258770 [compost metagenome]